MNLGRGQKSAGRSDCKKENMTAITSEYSGPLATFPLKRTGPSNAQWRRNADIRTEAERQVVLIEYAVRGTNTDTDLPYIDGIPSLRAVRPTPSLGKSRPGRRMEGIRFDRRRFRTHRKRDRPGHRCRP